MLSLKNCRRLQGQEFGGGYGGGDDQAGQDLVVGPLDANSAAGKKVGAGYKADVGLGRRQNVGVAREEF